MKRRISLVIAFALSFLMMFCPIARAGEIKVQITLTLPESTEIEIVQTPVAEAKKADSPTPRVKVNVQFLKEPKKPSTNEEPTCPHNCSNGAPGYMSPDGDCISC